MYKRTLARISTSALLVALGTGTFGAAQSWTPVQTGTTEDLTSIGFGLGLDCWITGSGGFVGVGDDCETFLPMNIGVGPVLLTSQNRNSSVDVWIGGEDGVVRRQTALDEWSIRDIPGGAGETFVIFGRSSGAAWAAGDGGRLFRNLSGNSDGWELSYDAGVPLYGGNGFVGSLTQVVGAGGLILDTPDGGATWTTLPSGTTEDLFAYVQSTTYLMAVGANGTVVKSTDSGATWQLKPSGTSATLRDLVTSGANANHMLAVGDGGVTLYSTDAGETWCFLHSTWRDLNAAWMPNNFDFWVIGDGGVMMRTTNGGGACQSGPLVLLFGDGFETGDASAWSAAFP